MENEAAARVKLSQCRLMNLNVIMCDRASGKRPPLTEQHEIEADIATINSARNDRHSRAAWAGGFLFPEKNCVATPANPAQV